MARRNNFNRLAHFVATVDAGTITGAADALGISKAVVSKQLQLLEADIGTPLLLRNTRHLQPTEAGRAFYEDAKSALIQANNAYERVQERDMKPRGALRITAPVDFGVSYLAPFVALFQDSYPDVLVKLHLADSLVDIIEDRFDLAFRIGQLSDSSNRARKLVSFEEIAVCSPTSAARFQSHCPGDLEGAPFVRSQAFASKTEWIFRQGDDERIICPHIVAEANITLAIRALVVSGFCFTVLPDFLVRDQLEDESLVRLFPDWSLRSGGIYAMTPPNRIRSNALQRFLEMADSELLR